MAIYKVSDLLDRLEHIAVEGYEFVDVRELEADDDIPTSILIDVIEDFYCSSEDEEIPSVKIPEDYDFDSFNRTHKLSDTCRSISFTYEEILTLSHAIDNAINFSKQLLDDPENKPLKNEIKQSASEWRNLQAKFAKFFKRTNLRRKS